MALRSKQRVVTGYHRVDWAVLHLPSPQLQFWTTCSVELPLVQPTARKIMMLVCLITFPFNFLRNIWMRTSTKYRGFINMMIKIVFNFCLSSSALCQCGVVCCISSTVSIFVRFSSGETNYPRSDNSKQKPKPCTVFSPLFYFAWAKKL